MNEFLRRDAYKHIYLEIGKRKTKIDSVNINRITGMYTKMAHTKMARTKMAHTKMAHTKMAHAKMAHA